MIRRPLDIDENTLPNDWDRSQVQPQEVRLVQNGRVLTVCPVKPHQRLHLSAAPGWLRADLIGTYHGTAGQHLAFTNPLFIRQRG